MEKSDIRFIKLVKHQAEPQGRHQVLALIGTTNRDYFISSGKLQGLRGLKSREEYHVPFTLEDVENSLVIRNLPDAYIQALKNAQTDLNLMVALEKLPLKQYQNLLMSLEEILNPKATIAQSCKKAPPQQLSLCF